MASDKRGEKGAPRLSDVGQVIRVSAGGRVALLDHSDAMVLEANTGAGRIYRRRQQLPGELVLAWELAR